MRKGIARILLALGVAGSSVVAMTGTAHAGIATGGGCRYDYAAVGYGYSLKPCVFPAAAADTISGYVDVKIAPNSTDVYVCAQLIPTSSLISANAGPVHCDYAGTSPNRTTYTTKAYANDKFPLRFRGGDWVYSAWIKESGHRYGDVQSARIYLPY
ncbi:hypothetical protein AB0395_27120 [Streptosporangium sp. NPDC051023]|uniref:hypothetical protein n=1 Tax=Streptosporangium sp. NPDC051023 TaxID=3155410 RepID=UPI00344B3E14